MTETKSIPAWAQERALLSGNEAVALAALHADISLGTGYPGTPSTEILETFSEWGGRAQWAPNEKVGLEVGIGVAFAGARALVTMKHVGVNVAADPLFTVAYTGVTGALVIISADDPGLASSQNEQDNRHYARAAAVPMLEPSDSQESYEFMLEAVRLSEIWKQPIILRMTTRVCHSKTLVHPGKPQQNIPAASFVRDIPGRVMIPAYARPAHHRLREKMSKLAEWNETSELNKEIAAANGSRALGIITSGVSYQHVRESAPNVAVLKLGMTWPLPMKKIAEFASRFDRCLVIDEGDPVLADSIRAAGISVEAKPEMYRFGELDVERVRRIIQGDVSPEKAPPRGRPPALCKACPYRPVFGAFRKYDCIVAGDIGCYTLGVLPPLEAMDTCVCMGGSISVGLGLRHALPPEQAKRVVSVIGDSTFVHSGITGLVEMVYNPPTTGHVVVILDNATTAMTGRQEHPGTGRTLSHEPTNQLDIEQLARAIGVKNVVVIDPIESPESFEQLLSSSLEKPELTLIISRRVCLLAAGKIREYQKAAAVPVA